MATVVCLDSLELDPSDHNVRLLLAECYWRLGQRQEAAASLDTIRKSCDADARTLDVLSAIFADRPEIGRRLLLDAAQSAADSSLEDDPALWARAAAILGENDLAFRCLDKAFERRETAVLLLNVDPAYRGLRDDSRFAPLVTRLGLAGAAD